jgi:hypothetical protein
MRRPTILLTLAISGWLLVACGATTRPKASDRAVTLGASATAGRASWRGHALEFARAVNLTAADVPGFTVAKRHDAKTARERRAEREMLRCTGSQGPGNGLTRVSSKAFELKRNVLDLSVSSEVGVAPSSALAAGELAAIRSARIKACFTRYLDEVLQGQRFAGAAIAPVSIQAGTPPAPGATGSFGWRVTASLTLRRAKLSFYMDILGFVYGPARVTLFSSSALLPFPAAAQQRLFGALLDRAEAYRL